MNLISHIPVIPVETLPQVGIQGTVYLIPNPSPTSTDDVSLLKIWDGSTYQEYGTSSFDAASFDSSLTSLESNIVLSSKVISIV